MCNNKISQEKDLHALHKWSIFALAKQKSRSGAEVAR